MASRLVALVPALATLAACQDPLGRCEQSVLPTCDPHEADCQRALHEHVACARGGDLESAPPTFEFLAVDAFRARYDRLPEPSLDAQKCLGVATLWPGANAVLEGAGPTALFDVEARRVVVVDGAEPGKLERPLLRAIAQAQRDAELGGFADWRDEHGVTFDQARALEALFAGEATLFADVAALKTGPQRDEDLRAIVDDELDDYEDAEREMFSYARSWGFDYRYVGLRFAVAGARFALKAYLAGDRAALAEAYARPVTSTAELVRRRLTDAEPVAPDTPYDVPPGYFHRAPERLGASAYFSFLMRVDPIDGQTDPIGADSTDIQQKQRYGDVAGAWIGDRFDCLIDESSESPLVVWELAFDPGVELPLFTMTRDAPGYWRWLEPGDKLLLVGGYDQQAVESVVASLESAGGQ